MGRRHGEHTRRSKHQVHPKKSDVARPDESSVSLEGISLEEPSEKSIAKQIDFLFDFCSDNEGWSEDTWGQLYLLFDKLSDLRRDQQIARSEFNSNFQEHTEPLSEEAAADFFSWLSANGVSVDHFFIQHGEKGNGLFSKLGVQASIFLPFSQIIFSAKCMHSPVALFRLPFQKDELVLEIPRRIMLTIETALRSGVGPLIQKDPLLKQMPSAALALFLVYERLKVGSR